MKPMWSVWRSWVAGLAALGAVWTPSAQPLTRAEAQALRQEFEQRYQRLDGMVQDLVEGQAALSQRLDALAATVSQLERRVAEPAPEVVTREQLAQAVKTLQQAVEKQQAEQNRKLTAELKRLQKLLAQSGGASRSQPAGAPDVPSEGYHYTIRPGDTISAIVDAYRKAGVKKLTVDLVLRANPGLKPERLKPGQEIFIPDPGK